MGLIFLSLFVCILPLSVSYDFNVLNRLVFVILSQPNSYHKAVAEKLEQELRSEMNSFHEDRYEILITPRDFQNLIGYWTVLPLFERLAEFKNKSWFIFVEERTKVDVVKLLKALSTYYSSVDLFVGHALKDEEPTIIHHFDSPDGYEGLYYPHFSAGFALTFPLLEKALSQWLTHANEQFSIDPKYELAKFLFKHCGTRLINNTRFCLSKNDHRCATWIPGGFPLCGVAVSNDHVFFAVKTCKKYHGDRVQVVKNTWAPEAHNIVFFSDEDNATIPTINLGVENVPRGHCEKTMSIIKHAEQNYNHKVRWLVIADDDTLLSVPRLLKLLACYNSSEDVAIGERYGYGLSNGQGYDYITGGGGMVFSMPTVKKLASSCRCPSVDSPDDMIIGMCLRRIGVSITHSPHFHQARPEDYDPDFLRHTTPVSFHKHWMVDPYEVYKTWLQEPQYLHSEL